MRILMYIVLFFLGYRVLKRFFAPNFGNINAGNDPVDTFNTYPTDDGDKSDVIEDVDYEEVD